MITVTGIPWEPIDTMSSDRRDGRTMLYGLTVMPSAVVGLLIHPAVKAGRDGKSLTSGTRSMA